MAAYRMARQGGAAAARVTDDLYSIAAELQVPVGVASPSRAGRRAHRVGRRAHRAARPRARPAAAAAAPCTRTPPARARVHGAAVVLVAIDAGLVGATARAWGGGSRRAAFLQFRRRDRARGGDRTTCPRGTWPRRDRARGGHACSTKPPCYTFSQSTSVGGDFCTASRRTGRRDPRFSRCRRAVPGQPSSRGETIARRAEAMLTGELAG